jgi:hypothetical protein
VALVDKLKEWLPSIYGERHHIWWEGVRAEDGVRRYIEGIVVKY